MTTKKPINIRASKRMRDQLAALTRDGSTVTEIVTVAVDRMYRDEMRDQEDQGESGS